MKTQYSFQTLAFGANDNGIHVLREGKVSTTYSFEGISSVSVEQGKAIKNWHIAFAIGIVGILAAIYMGWSSYNTYTNSTTIYTSSNDFIQRGLGPSILILVLGCVAIYRSLRPSPVLIIQMGDKRDHFPLKKLQQKEQLAAFIDFLKQHLGQAKVTVHYEQL